MNFIFTYIYTTGTRPSLLAIQMREREIEEDKTDKQTNKEPKERKEKKKRKKKLQTDKKNVVRPPGDVTDNMEEQKKEKNSNQRDAENEREGRATEAQQKHPPGSQGCFLYR